LQGRKLIAPVLAAVLAVAVAGGVWYSRTEVVEVRDARQLADAQRAREVTVRGFIGSREGSLLRRYACGRCALAKQGITVVVEKAGSRAIAGRFDAKQVRLRLPFGRSGRRACCSQQAKAAAMSTTPSTRRWCWPAGGRSPRSWWPTRLRERQGDIYYLVDLPALMALIEKGARWRDLKSSQAFATGKAVLINSTDVRTSNSAAMYLSLASYLANAQQIVQSAGRRGPRAAHRWRRSSCARGCRRQSSAGPFEDYLALGMGKAPLLMAYESQLIEFWLKNPDRLKADMVLLYPKPDGVFQARARALHTRPARAWARRWKPMPSCRHWRTNTATARAAPAKAPSAGPRRGIKPFPRC
jgi:hypothetical protein